MPETYGLPEPEPTAPDRVRVVAEQAIAGRSIVRVVILYMTIAAFAVSPLAPLAIVPLVMLMATDSDLTA